MSWDDFEFSEDMEKIKKYIRAYKQIEKEENENKEDISFPMILQTDSTDIYTYKVTKAILETLVAIEEGSFYNIPEEVNLHKNAFIAKAIETCIQLLSYAEKNKK